EKHLKDAFPESRHIRSIAKLPIPAKDIDIWNHALQNKFVIVTNDEDFYKLTMTHDICPKIIMIRTGNKKTFQIAELLINKKEEIIYFVNNDEYKLFEIR